MIVLQHLATLALASVIVLAAAAVAVLVGTAMVEGGLRLVAYHYHMRRKP